MNADFLNMCQEKADRHQIPIAALLTIMNLESWFRPLAIRFRNYNPWVYSCKQFAKRNGQTEETEKALQQMDLGLCQLPGNEARVLGFKGNLIRLLEPRINAEFGAAYIARLINEFGEEGMARAYKTGTSAKSNEADQYLRRYRNLVKKWEERCRQMSGH